MEDHGWGLTGIAPCCVWRLQVIAAAEASAKQLGATYRRMVSRAYHDSLFMAQIAPTGTGSFKR